MAASSPAFALSADAQKIVDQVVATIPDVKPVCSDRKKLRTAVSDATKTLVKGKQLSGEPKPAAQDSRKVPLRQLPTAAITAGRLHEPPNDGGGGGRRAVSLRP